MPSDLLAEAIREASRQRSEWLEDVLAGALINGVSRDEIEIVICGGHTTVLIRGVPKYEFGFTTVV